MASFARGSAKVALASGEAFAVDFYGDQLIQFAVPVAPVPTPSAGTGRGSAAITNTGTIAANGGTVWLGVDTAKQVVDRAINTTGVIEATAVRQQNGRIVLDGGNGGVTVSGTLDASGQKPGQIGGTVKVLGDRVALRNGAIVNVSGDASGGTALIGGNFHGAGPERSARKTRVAAGATIKADAITTGNGGQVAVWSDDQTHFNGTIYARGGALGGDGGFVETSGKQGLSVQAGLVDTSAPHGTVGDWLLDPDFINVSLGGTANLLDVGSFGATSGTTQFISPTTIGSALSNVTLQATQDVIFNAPVTMTHDRVGITARAGGEIVLKDTASITTRGGNIILSASDPAAPVQQNGGIRLGAPLRTNGGGLPAAT